MNLITARAALLYDAKPAERLNSIAVFTVDCYGTIQLTSELPESVILPLVQPFSFRQQWISDRDRPEVFHRSFGFFHNLVDISARNNGDKL